MYKQRILKEAVEAAKLRDENFVLIFNDQDLFNWNAFLLGPEDSPFKDGIFEVKITLNSSYPLNPPKMIFKTKIFHPNIHWETGEICLDIIKNEWTPSWTLESLCRSILCLMSTPNADSPLNCDAGNLVRNGYTQAYNNMAAMFTGEYAIERSKFQQFTKEFQKQNSDKNVNISQKKDN